MAERCELCGKTGNFSETALAGDYRVMTCRQCINRAARRMHDMPEFREWLATDRMMYNMDGLSAADVWVRADLYLTATKRLHDALDLLWSTARAHTPAPPLRDKYTEIIQHEVDQLQPVKPATVYLLGYDQARDERNISIHEFGVYSTRELAEAAKPQMQQFIPWFEKYAGEWWIEAIVVDSPDSQLRMRKERREPVKPATVYALASLGRVYLYSHIELHGVYTSPEAREAAKAKIAADANQEAREEGTKPLEFIWYEWEGEPMDVSK